MAPIFFLSTLDTRRSPAPALDERARHAPRGSLGANTICLSKGCRLLITKPPDLNWKSSLIKSLHGLHWVWTQTTSAHHVSHLPFCSSSSTPIMGYPHDRSEHRWKTNGENKTLKPAEVFGGSKCISPVGNHRGL